MNLCFGASTPVWFCEDEAWPGVRDVCDMARRDVERVTGVLPEITSLLPVAGEVVFVGTVGRSRLIDRLESEGKLELSSVRGKWEVYAFTLISHPLPGVERALVIAGSDKRGTIYGVFHLSELMGVSPLVDWADVPPKKRACVTLDDRASCVSREPSVRYRGIFLNDEWPALGTWATTRFGGFNAKFYAHVFELILRLKGNYLWPAMWHSCFSLDGPGLASAELADRLGVVMGASHHEPLQRAGEEYGLMRGERSPYGDAWDFRANKKGILKFWEDGLERNKAFESMITVGMRGEQDTPIMGRSATLQENIALLRDVLTEQNRLIKQCMGGDLRQVKRLFVLFTEVEAFFYGDQSTRGLMGDPELDGVTLMLSDDNFGNLRSLPTEAMRDHNGGFGLYYHLDFHGGAYAYDWMNTNHLPKLWEQLTAAWEGGIREVWIANIGDLCLLEYPLCYFMDMAYDMDSHGSNAVNQTPAWTKNWVRAQLGGAFPDAQQETICALLDAYTQINHLRKPEIMNVGVYHPTHYGETRALMDKAEWIEQAAWQLLAQCPKEYESAFWELVYFPAAATANHALLWLAASLNAFYTGQGRIEANDQAEEVQKRILRDRALTRAYHRVGNGRFYGMGLSEHIGFVCWCADGNRYPVMMRVEGANKPRLLVADQAGEDFTIGSRWSGDTLTVRYALHQSVSDIRIDLACGSREPVCYTVETDCPWIGLSHREGCVSRKDVLTLHIDRALFTGRAEGTVTVKSDTTAYIRVIAENRDVSALEKGLFLEADGVICMEAANYARKQDTKDGAFVTLRPYGRTGSAVKVLPPTADFTRLSAKPWVEYRFEASEAGEYLLELYLSPSNTATMAHELCFSLKLNDEKAAELNGVSDDYRSLDLSCQEWVDAVRSNIRVKRVKMNCRKGVNTLRLYGGSPLVVFERLVLCRADRRLPESYLGPNESYRVR